MDDLEKRVRRLEFQFQKASETISWLITHIQLSSAQERYELRNFTEYLIHSTEEFLRKEEMNEDNIGNS